ncbi:DUF721 domain-containing protein [Acinetobacter puyangensis]|uniref:DUF721 domain-containing protein n=1 Tax=Acinetobacter puyangensis TaxID=1096779 RepID=UPI003A4E3AB1
MRQSKPLFTALSQASSQPVGNFSFLQTQVAQWQKLTLLVQHYFPPQGRWQVVCYQHGTLTIAGDNQALISQVRYLQSQYIRNLKAIPALTELDGIQVVLHSTPKPTSKKYTRKKLLSNETQQALQQAAHLVKDAKLSQALQRLASVDQTESEEK